MFKRLKLKKRELNLFILCCIIIITVISYVVIVERFWKKYVSVEDEIAQKRVEFLKLQKLLLSKSSIERYYDEISSVISQPCSDEERLASFLKEVELAARSAGIYITSMKPVSILQEERYKKYLVRIETEGKMEALASFLYHLPDSSQLISLEQLQVNYLGAEQGRQDGSLQFKIGLERMVVDAQDEK